MQTPDGYLLLGNPAFAEQCMRALELKGDLPQLIDPRFSLGLTVDEFTTLPYQWLRRRIRYGTFAVGAPVAAQRSQVQLLPGAGTVADRSTQIHVQRISLHNRTALAQEIFVGLAANGAGGTVGPQQGIGVDDRSFSGNANSFAITRTGAAAASFLGTQSRAFMVPANSELLLPLEFVLTGRFIGANPITLNFEASSLNVELAVNLEWEERSLLTTEAT